jgi:hypothetical protein
MSLSISWPARRTARRGVNAFGLSALALLLGATILVAVETPSKPFLDKNNFYLSSAGFRVQFANDAEGKKAMRALPPHRFVIHALAGGDARYLFSEPQHCVCVFIGTKAAYNNYRTMLTAPLARDDDVAPDFKTQAGALLTSDPIGLNTIGGADSVANYFRTYY